MTHYYFYIKAGLTLDGSSSFYRVAVGESERGRRHLAWLEAYAAENGHFFVLMTDDSRCFVMDCLASIGRDGSSIQLVDAPELIRSLRTGCEVPANYSAILHRHRFMMQVDPHYFASYQISAINKRRP